MGVWTGTGGADQYGDGDADDTLSGLAGNDTLHGYGGADSIDGGEGDDVLAGWSGVDTLLGGIGNDVLDASDSEAGERYDGGVGADTLTASGNVDLTGVTVVDVETFRMDDMFSTLTAEVGTLAGFGAIAAAIIRIAGAGTLTLAGRTVTGLESLYLATAGNSVTLTGIAVAYGVYGGAGNDTVVGARSVYADGGDDSLTGTAGNDTLRGEAGVDTIAGGEGDDLMPVTAADHALAGERYDGGGGADTLAFDGDGDLRGVTLVATETLRSSYGTITVGLATLAGVTSVDADLAIGESGTLDLTGRTIAGGVVLHAGGNTVDVTGTGSGLVEGGAGNDVVTGAPEAVGGGGDDRLVGGTAGDAFAGDAGNDTLTGSAGADTLWGGLGSDSIEGGDGDDRICIHPDDVAAGEVLSGGSGSDRLFVEGADVDLSRARIGTIELLQGGPDPHLLRLTGAQLAGFTTIDADTVAISGKGLVDLVGTKFVGGIRFVLDKRGNDLDAFGSKGDIDVAGGKGADFIATGRNDDTLDGGAGRDTLEGAQGLDDFVFSTAPNARSIDTVLDFRSGLDRIVLDGDVFGLAEGRLPRADLLMTTTPTATAAAHVVYDIDDGALYLNADGSGTGALVQFAIAPGLTGAGDFFVV